MAHTTRKSLLIRIKDRDDTESWSQFVDLYGPLVYRFGRRKGLQEADASDMMQDVMQRVSQSIERFEYDPELGRFRSWLFLISRQCLSNQLKRKARQPIGSADSNVARMLNQIPSEEDESVWEDEYRRHLLDWAVEQIRHQFSDSSWQAFYETAFNNRPASEVACDLNMSVGAVYIAKSRITKRLREKVASVDDSLK
ncbi:MAG: sigma-70 family RNA polymerase sigma factor [Planctomycetota bacterium]